MLDRQSAAATGETDRILHDPSFRTLVRERTRFGWALSAAMLVAYLAFVVLAAYDNGFMSSTVGDSSVSWGILLGLGIIVLAFALTGIYVARANARFDALAARIDGGVR